MIAAAACVLAFSGCVFKGTSTVHLQTDCSCTIRNTDFAAVVGGDADSGCPSPNLVYSGYKTGARACKFRAEYWIDDNWYVGRIKEAPGALSQGESLDELKENIADAYRMVIWEESRYTPSGNARRKETILRAENENRTADKPSVPDAETSRTGFGA